MAKRKLSASQWEVLKVISKTGILPSENMKALNIKTTTINMLIENKLLKELDVLHHKTEISHCYKLTDSAIQRCYRNFGNVYNSSSPRHDIELNNQYCNLTKEERDNWLTESQIREIVHSRIEEHREESYYNELYSNYQEGYYSMPDCAYINSSGDICCIEITTDSYRQLTIEHKQNTADLIGASISYIKV